MRVSIACVQAGMKLQSRVSTLDNGTLLTREHIRLLEFLHVPEVDIAPIEDETLTDVEEQRLLGYLERYENHYDQWEDEIEVNAYEGLDLIYQLFQEGFALRKVVTFFQQQPLRRNHVIHHAVYRALVAHTLSLFRGDDPKLQLDYGLASYFADAGYAKIRKWSHMRYFPKMERELLYVHPVLSANLLDGQERLLRPRVRTFVQEHHERFNGSGFPNQLKRSELHPESPLFIVADRFCQLTRPHTFRNALTADEAIGYMKIGKEYRGPELSLLATVLGLYAIGKKVLLTNGETAVIDSYTSTAERPIVRLSVTSEKINLDQRHELEIERFIRD